MKVDIYTKIHKAHRKSLFALSEKIGRTNFADVSQVSHLKEEVKKIIKRLREHAQHEECFIHPLYAELGKQGEVFDHEHNDLENSLDLLEKNIADGQHDSNQIYTQFNQFIIFYLKHMDEEESAQREILWKYFDNDRLIDIIHHFQKSRMPEEDMEDLEFMLPCLNIHEILEILGSMKANAPEAAFQYALGIVEKSFGTEEYSKIQKILSEV
jgi:hypothetical protein